MVRNSEPYNKETKKGLYLIATPIGNLDDITFRAVTILKKSDYILCEDTRVSKILLKRYDIKAKLISNHKFNEKKNLLKIVELLKNGSIISLISDAGTPGISDPGAMLVNECIKNNIIVIPLPGPSSVIAAVSISGFSEKFFFYGFFPEKKKTINDDLAILSKLNSSIIFFISAKKINRIIPYLKKSFYGRKILICREMTKYFEEFIRTDIDLLDSLKFELKGELTIVISENKSYKKVSQNLEESDKRLINQMINKLSIKEITGLISQKKKISKKEIYNYCIKIKNEN
jgi:16S rRNA (cytidine1402-2'-O)-methyltransferase